MNDVFIIALFVYLATITIASIWMLDKDHTTPNIVIYIGLIESILFAGSFIYFSWFDAILPNNITGWVGLILGVVVFGALTAGALWAIGLGIAHISIVSFYLLTLLLSYVVGYKVLFDKMEYDETVNNIRWVVLSILNVGAFITVYLFRTLQS